MEDVHIEPKPDAVKPANAPFMDVAPPHTPPLDARPIEHITKVQVPSKPANQPINNHQPSDSGSGVGIAVTATVIIVLALAAIATYAYLQTITK